MTSGGNLQEHLRDVKQQIESIKSDVNTHWDEADTFDGLDRLGQHSIDKIVDAQNEMLECYDKILSAEQSKESEGSIRAIVDGALKTAMQGSCDFFKGVCEDLD